MLSLNHITFACADPQRLAEFWASILDGYEIELDGDVCYARGDGPELFALVEAGKIRSEPSQTFPLADAAAAHAALESRKTTGATVLVP